MPRSRISDEAVKENAEQLYRHTNFLPSHILPQGAEGASNYAKEMELLASQNLLEGQFTKENEGDQDHSYHSQRAKSFDSGFKLFLTEVSGGNLSEGELREIYTELFDNAELAQLAIEEQSDKEAA